VTLRRFDAIYTASKRKIVTGAAWRSLEDIWETDLLPLA